MPAPIMVTGFITREAFLLGKTLAEMERVLGYRSGRLAAGVSIYALLRLPQNHEFKFAGYTHWPGGEPVGGRPAVEFDEAKIKNDIREHKWALRGPNRVVKVKPLTAHSEAEVYPPGAGAEQWVLTAPMPAELLMTLHGDDRYLPYRAKGAGG
jgi:hypothetical protein